MKLADLVPNPGNPKEHHLDTIDASIDRFGYLDPIVIDERTGRTISGHGRTETLAVMEARGETAPDGVMVTSTGAWQVPVIRGWSSTDDREASAALVALNRTTELGGWDDTALAGILTDLAQVEGGLAGVGFNQADLDALVAELNPVIPEPKPVRDPSVGPGNVVLYHGDNLQVMAGLPENHVHAVVTDPPYGLEFMGRDWDTVAGGPKAFEEWSKKWAQEAFRVLRPGGHLIAFGATRTHHRLMVGIEDAGFEIRDMGVWMYRSGFPKSMDVSLAIDKAAGAERSDRVTVNGSNRVYAPTVGVTDRGVPVTADAVEWDGWGTGLKPAIEPWVLARKPLSEPTVSENVTRWGTGALNIDAARVPGEEPGGG